MKNRILYFFRYPITNLAEHKDDSIAMLIEVKYYIRYINAMGEYVSKKLIITYETSLDKNTHHPFIFADLDFDDKDYEKAQLQKEKDEEKKVEYWDQDKKVDWKKWL